MDVGEKRPHNGRHLRALMALTSTLGLILAVGAAVFLVAGSAGAEPDGKKNTPTPAPSATATLSATSTPPSATPTFSAPTPVETPPSTAPPPPKESRTLPPGLISSDRAVVHTGDGDCLNVRPVPSKKFESDPRFCLNEGEIVYLHGDAVQADGETWRYALGRGWLATRYVYFEPAPGRDLLEGFSSLVLRTTRWQERPQTMITEYSRMDGRGRIEPVGAIEYRQWGIGGGQPTLSPDARYTAVTTNTADGDKLTLVVRHLESGSEYRIDDVSDGQWSVDGRLLVLPTCRGEGCPWSFGVFDTSSGDVTRYSIRGETKWVTPSWLPDGSGVIAVADCRRLYRVTLGGDATKIAEQSDDRACYGGLVVSPDATYGLAGGIYGPLTIVDLNSGATREFQRAKRIVEPAGKCGGSVGQLVDVLDNGRIVYHESLAAKGSNGITIGDLATGHRRVLSFWNIADLEAIGPNRVTFTSFEQMNDLSFQLTWLLDTSTGEARPIAVGAEAAWTR